MGTNFNIQNQILKISTKEILTSIPKTEVSHSFKKIFLKTAKITNSICTILGEWNDQFSDLNVNEKQNWNPNSVIDTYNPTNSDSKINLGVLLDPQDQDDHINIPSSNSSKYLSISLIFN